MDVNVVLRGLSHVHSDDIDVMLVAPDGTSTVLMSDVGGFSGPSGTTLTIDDQAPTPLPDAAPLLAGIFQPANYEPGDSFPSAGTSSPATGLARFEGGSPNGQWKLYVVDDAFPDGGEFSGGWTLELTMEVDQENNRRRRDRR